MKQLKGCLFVGALAFAGLQPAFASSLQWDLQGKTYNVDTVYHAKIGPGTTQTSLRLTGSSVMNLFYTTTDLSDPHAEMRVTKAGGSLEGLAKLSVQQKASDREGARYFAGVNADFFGGKRPIGSVVVDGDTYYAVNNGWDCFYTTQGGSLGLGNVVFKGAAKTETASHAITGINSDRGENALVVYNRFRGATTGTNTFGIELRLELLEGSVGYTGSARCRVASEAGDKALSLSGDQLVLSGHGTGADFIRTLSVGQEITLDFVSEIAGEGPITQLVGARPVLLRDGVVQDTQGAIDHLVANHPRTAVGYDKTCTKVVMMVVDGRTTVSKGCTSRVLADIMRYAGCSEAVNFDGGGSTELYTSAFGVRNHPSDGSERTVVNALWAVSTAPDDNEVAEIAFEYHTTFVTPRYGHFEPRVYAYNKYGMLVSTDFKDYTLSCPEALGVISEDGKSLFANGSGVHALTAEYAGHKATIAVEIGAKQPEFQLKNVLIDAHTPYCVEVAAEVNGDMMKIDNSALQWASDNEAVATVDENGVIKGITEGTATITGTVDGYTDKIDVTVQIPAARYMSPVPMRAENWTLASTGMSKAEISDDAAGLRIDYNAKNGRSASATIRSEATLYALPDSMRVAFSCGDGEVASVAMSLTPAGKKSKTVTIPLQESGAGTVVLLPMSNVFDVEDFTAYPVTFNLLKYNFNPTIGVDRKVITHSVDAVYSYLDPSGVEGVIAEPSAKGIVVNGNIVTIAGGEGRYEVYNAAGMLVAAGNGSQFSTASLAPGLYIVRSGAVGAKLMVK